MNTLMKSVVVAVILVVGMAQVVGAGDRRWVLPRVDTCPGKQGKDWGVNLRPTGGFSDYRASFNRYLRWGRV